MGGGGVMGDGRRWLGEAVAMEGGWRESWVMADGGGCRGWRRDLGDGTGSNAGLEGKLRWEEV